VGVGMIEIVELAFPFGGIEINEDRAKSGRIVEGFVGESLDVGGCKIFAWGGGSFAATAEVWTTTPTAAFGALFFEEFAGGFAFGGVENLVAAEVDFFSERKILARVGDGGAALSVAGE